jgi:hypothetical protein
VRDGEVFVEDLGSRNGTADRRTPHHHSSTHQPRNPGAGGTSGRHSRRPSWDRHRSHVHRPSDCQPGNEGALIALQNGRRGPRRRLSSWAKPERARSTLPRRSTRSARVERPRSWP